MHASKHCRTRATDLCGHAHALLVNTRMRMQARAHIRIKARTHTSPCMNALTYTHAHPAISCYTQTYTHTHTHQFMHSMTNPSLHTHTLVHTNSYTHAGTDKHAKGDAGVLCCALPAPQPTVKNRQPAHLQAASFAARHHPPLLPCHRPRRAASQQVQQAVLECQGQQWQAPRAQPQAKLVRYWCFF
jgi:hypothetical protein